VKRNIQVNKIVIAWLLSVVFVLPFIAKAVHIYENEYCTSACSHTGHDESTKHDCNTCHVCQFSLSFFTEADFTSFDAIPITFYIDIIIPYKGKLYNSITHLNYLRAPPLMYLFIG
jgi:hypothetical protein